MPLGRSVVHASSQGRPRRVHEFINRSSVRCTMHVFEHLKQAPTLALITLRVQDAFSFEIYIIDKGVASLWSSRQAFELLLDVGAVGRRRLGEHFWKRLFQPCNKEFSLEINRIDEKLP